MRIRLLAVAAVLALTGCSGDSGKTDDLRDFLRQAHEFDTGYDDLGQVTYEDGQVTIDTEPWHDPAYGAYLYCAWAEDWVRGEQGDADADIVVIMGGEEVLRARGASETCADAEPAA